MRAPPAVRIGRVKMFMTGRGFGYIVADEDGAELYFPTANIIDAFNPVKGERVQFTIGKSRNGAPCAENVRVIR